jgi:hypothetical protein
MIRDFGYKGEAWRVAAHGIPGSEEVFIVHIGLGGVEDGPTAGPMGRHEASIDRMTEPNDTSAPLEDIIVMLCDRLIDDCGIEVSDPSVPFAWDTSGIRYMVHDGVRAFARA